jgi:hypothetical protein
MCYTPMRTLDKGLSRDMNISKLTYYQILTPGSWFLQGHPIGDTPQKMTVLQKFYLIFVPE